MSESDRAPSNAELLDVAVHRAVVAGVERQLDQALQRLGVAARARPQLDDLLEVAARGEEVALEEQNTSGLIQRHPISRILIEHHGQFRQSRVEVAASL